MDGVIKETDKAINTDLNFKRIAQNYVTGDPSTMVIQDANTREIGNIPIADNYELSSPKPLDARMLAKNINDLLSGAWWTTRFQKETILYKGMIVGCSEEHAVYVYRGETRVVRSTDTLNIKDWKKQRLDDSQLVWPINFDTEERLHIGYELEDPYTQSNGIVITLADSANRNSGKYGSIYMNKSFISIGTNKHDSNTDASLPFVPANGLTGWSGTQNIGFVDSNRYTQTGIFIPIANNHDKAPEKFNLLEDALSIFSAKRKGVIIETDWVNKVHGKLQITDTIEMYTVGNINVSTLTGGYYLDISSNIDFSSNNGYINFSAPKQGIHFDCGKDIVFESIFGNVKLDALYNVAVDSCVFEVNSHRNVSIFSDGSIIMKTDTHMDFIYRDNFKIKHPDRIAESVLIDYENIKLEASKLFQLNVPDGSIKNTAKGIELTATGNVSLKANTLRGQVNTINIGSNDTQPYKHNISAGATSGDTSITLMTSAGSNNQNSLVLSTGTNGVTLSGNHIYLHADKQDYGKLIELKCNENIKVEAGTDIAIRGNKTNGEILLDAKEIKLYNQLLPPPPAESGVVLVSTATGGFTWSTDVSKKTENTRVPTTGTGSTGWGYLKLAEILESAAQSLILSVAYQDSMGIYAVAVEGTTAKIHVMGFKGNEDNELKIYTSSGKKELYMNVKNGMPISWNAISATTGCTITSIENLTNPNYYVTSDAIKNAIDNETATTEYTKDLTWDQTQNVTNASKTSMVIPNPISSSVSAGETRFLRFTSKGGGIGLYDWGNLDNKLTDMASVDEGNKIYILGSERSGALGRSVNEFFNSTVVYIDQYQNIFATAFYAISDRNKKDDIKEIEYNDASILTPKSFIMKDSGKKSYGFIAQEVEEQGYPEIVNTDEDGTKTLNYTEAFSIVIAQMQEKIKQLEEEIRQLKANK